jgi:hypothetical protein
MSGGQADTIPRENTAGRADTKGIKESKELIPRENTAGRAEPKENEIGIRNSIFVIRKT